MKPAFTSHDEAFMRVALRRAARRQGYVEPNPMVGAVIVRNGKIISQAAHQRFGGPHAEVLALAAAGRRAQGATLYVTLEPCCHWGKTPPCTDAILASGIRRVVAAMIDPFAQVRGKGARLLRARGIQVDIGLLEAEAKQLNAPFIRRLRDGLPWVIAKWAQTLDGCIATASGESRWISSEESRAWVQKLRGRVDAIVVGVGTALQDDPLLMARPEKGSDIRRLATRIVLDSHCRLPVNSQLVRTISFAPVMVVHVRNLDAAARRRAQLLSQRGVMLLEIPADKTGRPALRPFLKQLAARDYTNVLLEGGPETLASFLRQNLVNEAHLFIAPKILGGHHSRHAVGGPDPKRLADALNFSITEIQQHGPDLHLTLHHQ